jgi:chromosome segregation ATPase
MTSASEEGGHKDNPSPTEYTGLVERLERLASHYQDMTAYEAASAITSLSTRVKELEEVLDHALTGELTRERDGLRSEVERLTRERDEAQARCFRLADQVESLEDTARNRRHWLDEAKRSRGYHINVTFDRVWEETCAKADRADAAEARLQQMTKALEEDRAIVDRARRLTATFDAAIDGAKGDHAIAILANYGESALNVLKALVASRAALSTQGSDND